MATSAQTLDQILITLSKKYKFDKEAAVALLAKEELLPKKMIPKSDKEDSPFASKKAEELAAIHGITAEGQGSGKNGKWTLADVEKHMSKPTKTKMLISPNALNLANEHQLSLVDKTGSGKDGRILLKDVEKWISADSDDEELNISPRALQEANEANISDEELATMHGSGKEGRILLEDIKSYISESDGTSSDSSQKKKLKKISKKSKVESDSESDSD